MACCLATLPASLATPGPGPSPPVTTRVLLLGWQLEPLALVALAVTLACAAAYVAGVRRLARRGHRWNPWRTAAFLGAMAVVVIAVNSGVAAYDDRTFYMHVIQHLLLMMAAGALIALSAPVTLLLQAGSRSTQTRALRVLNSSPVQLLTFPGVSWVLGFGSMYAYFLTPIYAYTLRHPLVHDLSHLEFLVAGVLYWMPVVGVDRSRWQMPYPIRLFYVFLGIPFASFLGVALISTSRTLSPAHTVADIHTGGAILWVMEGMGHATALLIIAVQWARHEERRSQRESRRMVETGAYEAQLAAYRAAMAAAGHPVSAPRTVGGPAPSPRPVGQPPRPPAGDRP